MTDSETNSCSWSEVTEDSQPLDVELSFHMDQNCPSIDSYAARVRHSLPEDVEPVNPPLRRRADYLSAFE